jgi:hypothetical protein
MNSLEAAVCSAPVKRRRRARLIQGQCACLFTPLSEKHDGVGGVLFQMVAAIGLFLLVFLERLLLFPLPPLPRTRRTVMVGDRCAESNLSSPPFFPSSSSSCWFSCVL